MGSQFITELFSSWKIILACAALMVLLPLLFYAASMKPRRIVKLTDVLPSHPRKAATRAPAVEDEEAREADESRFERSGADGGYVEKKGRRGKEEPQGRRGEARGKADERTPRDEPAVKGRAVRRERVETREEAGEEEAEEKHGKK